MGLVAVLSVCFGMLVGFMTGRYINRRGLRYFGVFIAAIVTMIGGFMIGLAISISSGFPEMKVAASGQGAWMGLFGCIFGALMAKMRRKKLIKSGKL